MQRSSFTVSLGCSSWDREDPRWEPLELIDETAVCLQSGTDGALAIQAIATRCFSSSCTTVVEASCRAEQVNGTITVQTAIQVEQLRGPDVVCTTDCMRIAVDCEALAPVAGEYTIFHSEASASVVLPTERVVVFEDAGFSEGWCGPSVK